MLHKVTNNETLFDIAIQYYGSIEGIIHILNANNLEFNSTLNDGMSLSIPEVKMPVVDFSLTPSKSEKTNKQVIAEDGQNIWDLALQTYGSLEGAILLIEENGKNWQAPIYAGQRIKVTKPPIDVVWHELINKAKVVPITGQKLGLIPPSGGSGSPTPGTSPSAFTNGFSNAFQ